MILLLILLILILTMSFKEHFNEIYLQDPFIYQQLNKIKDNGLDPLTYQQSLDNFGEYKKYRKSYQFPKYGKYSDSVDVIDSKPYTHIGCFRDNDNRALPIYYGTGYNAWQCAQKAKSVGSPFFGLQYPQGGTSCFVGNSNTPYDQYGKASNCISNKGGVWANTVYQIKGSKPPQKSYTSLGCWRDRPSRAISRYFGYFSVDKCAKLAKQLGYSVFGSQYGGQCFASHNAQNTYNKYGRANNCSNGTGGGWANNVYQLKNTTKK